LRTDHSTGRPRICLVALVCLLATSFLLYLQNLGTSNISTWDEVIHANVVKNLAERCCLPQLHRFALGTDFRDWGNNTVWLHKPLLPFYTTAAVYKLLGGSLWAFRLPGAIFALLTALVIYLIGSHFLNENIGLLGAAIFGLNPFTNALVHGTTYSGFPDLFFVFFVTLALYLILQWTKTKSVSTLRWFGLAVGLAYLSKGGLALAPFAVLGLVAFLTGSLRELIPIPAFQSIAVFAIVVVPEKLYWRVFHPVEFGYEQRQQLFHLFTNIEGHAAPWHFYFTHSLPHILVPALVPVAYFSIAWALVRCRPGTPPHTLSIWSLAYLVPLSFGVSKIDNFIFAVLPAVALLIPLAVESLMHRRQFRLVLLLCLASIGTYLLWETIVLSHTVEGLVIRTRWAEHPYACAFLALGAILLLGWSLPSLIKFDSKTTTATVLALTAVALLLLYVHTSIAEAWTDPLQYNGLTDLAQVPLRQTGTDLRQVVGKNALVIVALDDRRLADSLSGFFACGPGPEECISRLTYLYLMYWSDADVLDVCRDPNSQMTLEHFREWKNAYLITNRPLAAVPVADSPMGEVYSLSDVPFEVWGPVAAIPCSVPPVIVSGPGSNRVAGNQSYGFR
jgi:4-amino-4-deoxy-L-arabinose transferase-like glycosyltransferase